MLLFKLKNIHAVNAGALNYMMVRWSNIHHYVNDSVHDKYKGRDETTYIKVTKRFRNFKHDQSSTHQSAFEVATLVIFILIIEIFTKRFHGA